jgi:hypothetical protein
LPVDKTRIAHGFFLANPTMLISIRPFNGVILSVAEVSGYALRDSTFSDSVIQNNAN